jgi:cobalt-zinc-cadmium efflux system membrane fusion protein
VFRKLEDDLFEARRIEIGSRNGLYAMVTDGLSPEEEIVTEGSYIVKSELLKARLGAGCTDE